MNAQIPAWLLGILGAAILLVATPSFAEWRFEFLGASSTPLSNPHDLKLSRDGKILFVADVGSGRVVGLDPDTLELVDAFGEDILRGTHDIDFDERGRMYVADTHQGRAAVFAMLGTRGELVGSLSERLSGPEGVLAHPNGLIYVAGAWSNNVVAFQGDEVVYELAGLSAPHDLEVAPDGRIWLADAGNDRVLLLSESLAVIRELSGPPFDFDGVRYLDVLPDGTLVAADKYTHTVKVIDPSGSLLATLGTGRPGKGDGVFRTPEGVESAGDMFWFSDSGNDRIVKYRLVR
jgi:DNA-binding beta-propeller fold protein YncE